MASADVGVLSDESKVELHELLTKGELEFVTLPPECRCTICRTLLIFHVLFPCGHPYCRSCYNQLVSAKQTCRRCLVSADNQKRQSKDLDEIVSRLETFCRFKKRGCRLFCHLGDLLDHLKECGFRSSASKSLPSLNSDTKNAKISEVIDDVKRELKEELSKNVKATKDSLDQMKLMFEVKMKVADMERGRAELAVDKKLEAVISSMCASLRDEFEQRLVAFGVSFNVKLQEIIRATARKTSLPESRLQSAPRMDTAIQVLQNIQGMQESLADEVAALKVNKSGTMIWEVTEFASKKEIAANAEGGTMDFCSEYFYSDQYGYKMRLVVEFKKEALGVFLQLAPGERSAYLPAVYAHRRIFALLDQGERDDKRHIVSTQEPRFRDGRAEKQMTLVSGYSPFCTYHLLENKFHDVYLRQNKILLRVNVEPIFPLLRPPASYNGLLFWKVTNYRRVKQESQDKICDEVASDSFYTSTHGYRMQCFLYFDQTNLNVYADFMAGEYDDGLPDLFAHKVTFIMLDRSKQHSSKNDLVWKSKLDPKCVTKEDALARMRARKCHDVNFTFESFERLLYLVRDTIVIRVEVESI